MGKESGNIMRRTEALDLVQLAAGTSALSRVQTRLRDKFYAPKAPTSEMHIICWASRHAGEDGAVI